MTSKRKKYLSKRLKKESKITKDDSILVLKEFEKFENEKLLREVF